MIHSNSKVVQDAEGLVTWAWLSPGVLYARYEQTLSADVSAAVVAALTDQVARVESFELYVDASKLVAYELKARSSFVSFVREHRKRCTALALLPWKAEAPFITPAALDSLGQPTEIVADANDFGLRLLRVVPAAPELVASLRNLASEERRSFSVLR
ncbi:MAG TPA: hypothetical protein VFQ35_09420 [Polyangiaceae bacterium]|nr:hypothetical protein [Polyangiaceae bacterium]